MATDQRIIDLVLKGVSDGQYPRTLYKYREFNKFTESIFKDNSLWFSKPADFNDPFDCRIVDKGNYTTQDLLAFLVGLGMDPAVASSRALQYATDPKAITQLVEDTKNHAFNARGILALSECPDSILMWSYYCAGHSGFVLGFTVEADPAFFAIPLHVRYVKDYPAFQYLKEKNKIVEYGMVSKLELWDHEREIRVIKKGPGLRQFEKKCLSEVILGAKTTDADRNLIIKCLKDYGYSHVQLKRAVPSDSAFQLRIENLTVP